MLIFRKTSVQCALLAMAGWVLSHADESNWYQRFPAEWAPPIEQWVGDAAQWLIDAQLGPLQVAAATRWFSGILEVPLLFFQSALATRFEAYGAVDVGGLPWWCVVVTCGGLAYGLGDRRLAFMLAVGLSSLASLGLWQSTMLTFSAMLVGIPLASGAGFLLGLGCYRWRQLNRILSSIFDLMQTVPVFAYLVPILMLFGFGPVSAMLATTVYAMPPMARLTALGLREISSDVKELGSMLGCSPPQKLRHVFWPVMRPTLAKGLNQVIMLSLNMVIIASMVGAGGLGADLLRALRRLAVGRALEVGLAITFLAVALDRSTDLLLDRRRKQRIGPRLAWGLPLWLAFSFLIVWWAPGAGAFPEAWQWNSGKSLDQAVEWLNIHTFSLIDRSKDLLLIHVLIPIRRAIISFPWPIALLILARLGFAASANAAGSSRRNVRSAAAGNLDRDGAEVSRFRSGMTRAVQTVALASFVVLSGYWEPAMVTVYLCGISSAVTILVAAPIGWWASTNDSVHNICSLSSDVLQTLPSFVYLIPAVMLFQVGEITAMIAVICFALAPAVTYIDFALRSVDTSLKDLTKMLGCTRLQALGYVSIPSAWPALRVGLNQVIVLSLSMVVITALVGTRDLGQEVYIALTRADLGKGLVAGFCVAVIALVAERLI